MRIIWNIPLLGRLARKIYRLLCNRLFPGSRRYWERRYARGGDSGSGSSGELREYKAGVINSFVKSNDIQSVVEYGCGDGGQLSLSGYPAYAGLDVSPAAIELCRSRYAGDESKRFYMIEPENPVIIPADLGLSLDVIFHLVEDEIYDKYMKALFTSSKNFVIIYSSNHNETQFYQTRNREFTSWVVKHAPGWRLIKKIDNPYFPISRSDFYIFQKVN